MRAQIQQKQAKYKLKKTLQYKEIEKLNQEIKIYKENFEQYRNEMTQNFKEQKKHQGKMETWFIRRLEKLELIILDQHNPELNNIVQKIRKFKKKRPWKKQSQNLLNNSKNITNINNKKTIITLQSDGTTTPYSNYSEFSNEDAEDAESHDKTINKGFIISEDTSHRSSIQQVPLQSNNIIKNLQQKENIIIKNPQNDLNLSVSQLEQLMLNYLQHTDSFQNVNRLNLKDVQLEDLLDVTQQNNSGSMELDFHKDQKQTIQNTSFEKLINSFASKQMSRQFNKINKNKEQSQDNFPQELSSINLIDLSQMKSQNNSFQNINNISCIEKDFRKKSNTYDLKSFNKTGKSAMLFLNEIQEECKDLESPATKRNLNQQFQDEVNQQKQQDIEFNPESNNKFSDCSPFNTANLCLKNMNETVNYEDKQQYESPKKLKTHQDLEQNNQEQKKHLKDQEQNNKNMQENIQKNQNLQQPNKLNTCIQKNKQQDDQNKDKNDQFQILKNKYNSVKNFTNHESTSSPIDQSLFTEKNQEMAKKIINLNFKQITWNDMSPKMNNKQIDQKPTVDVKIRLRPKQLKIQHKSCDGRQQLMDSSPIIKKQSPHIQNIQNNNEQKQNTNQSQIYNFLKKPVSQIQNNQFKFNFKTENNSKPIEKQIQYNSNNVNISLNLKDQQINIRNQFMKKDKAKPLRAKILTQHQSNINNSNLNISVNSNDQYQYDNCQTPFQQNLPIPLQNKNVDRSLSSDKKGMYFEMNGIQQQLQLLEQHHSINLQQQKSFQSGMLPLSLYSPVNNINLFISNNQNQDISKNAQNNMVNSISTKNDNEIKKNILKNAIQLANQKKKQESIKVQQNLSQINHMRPKSNILSTSFQYKGKENSDKNQKQDIFLKGLQGNVSIQINNQEKLKSINRMNSISTHCAQK